MVCIETLPGLQYMLDVAVTGDYSMDASEAMAMVGGYEMQA